MRPRHATESDKSPLLPALTPPAAPLSRLRSHRAPDFHPDVTASPPVTVFPLHVSHTRPSSHPYIYTNPRNSRASRNPYLHPPSNATRTRCPTPAYHRTIYAAAQFNCYSSEILGNEEVEREGAEGERETRVSSRLRR